MEEQKSKKEVERELREKQIEEMKVLSEKLELQKKEMTELIEIKAKQQAEDLVSGQSEAGKPQVQETEEERIKREANEYLESTGMKI